MKDINEKFDKVIIGAGLYGLYSANLCGKNKERVLVLECESNSFTRATYINQARVHQGYHYPRSIATAVKSAGYFTRFCQDFSFCINNEFDQIYATSSQFSWTDGEQFKAFCHNAGIPCEEVNVNKYFKNDMCDGAFLTKEYTYDAKVLNGYFINELEKCRNVQIRYNRNIERIEKEQDRFIIHTREGETVETSFVLNTTYASTNQVSHIAGFDSMKIKYELCEIILCRANENLNNIGFTIMDGPFFSVMPFGKTGLHSLTSVTFTPHSTSYEEFPTFKCQQNSGGYCSSLKLGNCNLCVAKPQTADPYMKNLSRKYLLDEYDFGYIKSLYSMKPILLSSEIDDSRPTVVIKWSEKPTFISVLSGKINTIYDLDEVLIDEK